MSDRITIINNDDGTVDVNLNGENVANVPTTNLDSSIHAVQWYGDHGEVEYKDHNEEITDFSEFDVIMTDRQTEIDRIDEEEVQEALDNEPSEEEKDRTERDTLLEKTDWIIVKFLDTTGSIPQEWSDYRQALRDVTEQSGFPGNVDWPVDPTFNIIKSSPIDSIKLSEVKDLIMSELNEDEDSVNNVDISDPPLIGVKNNTPVEIFNGNHRLQKAINLGHDTIDAVLINIDELGSENKYMLHNNDYIL